MNGYFTHTQQIIDAVLENPYYQQEQGIRLVMCHGKNEAAEDFANTLGASVLASSKRVRLDDLGQLFTEN
ncbi:MAG: hypothetical protein Q4D96_13780 [Propionibacteriaceae bacterium]|nr:hypothetical protein [Propionibacteriaceae bacterium]